MTCMCAYNISFLSINLIFNALWSHPHNGDLILPPSFTTVIMKVVSVRHDLSQSKISYFDDSILINPALKLDIVTYALYRLVSCTYQCKLIWKKFSKNLCTHIQFLAARSRCTNLYLARYCIPLPI